MNVVVPHITTSFRHADKSPALAAYVKRRARSVARFVDGADRIRVVCGQDAGLAGVEVIAHVPGRQLVARAETDDMYDAVDVAFDTLLHRVVRDHARRVRAPRHVLRREEPV